jgi:prepilin-type N-terminal cleavage/methylation domain-containing protein
MCADLSAILLRRIDGMNRKHAFSLVELSIVLVILGLLTGGILTGQNLIHAAELRKAATDMDMYRVAVHSFKNKYFAIPGDMAMATDFWGIAGGSGYDTTCLNAQSAGDKATCNGDGNGYVRHGIQSQSERFLAWKHLANAGLISGSYTGKTIGPGVHVLANGVNVPQYYQTNGHVVISMQEKGHSQYFAESRLGGNLLLFGATSGASSDAPLFIPEDAWNLDKKFDDASPAYGSIFTTPATSTLNPGCSTTDIAATAEYAITEKTTLCMLAAVL